MREVKSRHGMDTAGVRVEIISMSWPTLSRLLKWWFSRFFSSNIFFAKFMSPKSHDLDASLWFTNLISFLLNIFWQWNKSSFDSEKCHQQRKMSLTVNKTSYQGLKMMLMTIIIYCNGLKIKFPLEWFWNYEKRTVWTETVAIQNCKRRKGKPNNGPEKGLKAMWVTYD